MPIAIISDIHGNLEALQAVFEYIDNHKIKQIHCLGDIVGYGPNPNECVEMIRERCDVVLMGNHDYAAIGLANIDYFNEYAKMATYWTMQKLTEANQEFLNDLPFTHQNDDMIMVHASPTNPSHWYYVLSQQDALIEMQAFNQPLCFIGHSHVPIVYGNEQPVRGEKIQFEPNKKYIVNVGSVGQPRDGNPQSCLVIYDEQNRVIEYVRVSYDAPVTYRKIVQAGLPLFLAERILKGF